MNPGIYFPLAVGNRWTYRVEAPGGEARDETIKILGRDGPWFLDDHRQRLRTEPDGVRDADRYLLKAPLQSGAKWSSVDNLIVQRFEITATGISVTTRAGTFKDCIARLPDVAAMGFDVVYFTPINPIGETNRKGKNI